MNPGPSFDLPTLPPGHTLKKRQEGNYVFLVLESDDGATEFVSDPVVLDQPVENYKNAVEIAARGIADKFDQKYKNYVALPLEESARNDSVEPLTVARGESGQETTVSTIPTSAPPPAPPAMPEDGLPIEHERE